MSDKKVYIDANLLKAEITNARCTMKPHYMLADEVIEIINTQATADVEEVRHGQWIKQECGTYKPMYRCSVCGRVLMGYSDLRNVPYCHCGAKMVEK